MFNQILDAFAALSQGNAAPMDDAIEQHGEAAVAEELAKQGIDLSAWWPPQSEQPTDGSSQDDGVMRRTPYSGSGISTLDDAMRAPGVDASETSKDEYRYGYSEEAGEEAPKKKKSNKGLWGLALIIAALAFGA